MEIFPQPRMAIAGLRSRWDKLTGNVWGKAFEESVERNVVVSRIWRWETQHFPYQNQRYVGVWASWSIACWTRATAPMSPT